MKHVLPLFEEKTKPYEDYLEVKPLKLPLDLNPQVESINLPTYCLTTHTQYRRILKKLSFNFKSLTLWFLEKGGSNS